MTVRLANGATIAIASSYGVAVDFTISNANPAVITTASSPGFITGDIVHLTSGWGKLNNRVVRLTVLTSTTAQLEDIDTTDTDIYPTGGGAGSAREVATWQQITQVRGTSTSGGEQQYVDTTALESADNPTQIPTRRNPTALSLEIMDDPTLAWYDVARAAAGVETALRIVFKGGSRLLASAFISLQETPSMDIDQPLRVNLDIAYAALPVRYAD